MSDKKSEEIDVSPGEFKARLEEYTRKISREKPVITGSEPSGPINKSRAD